ncbi:lytic transglycosylase domain-containing protein [Sphingobium fuliginis]|uniref:Lytic transglycosylase domain-containing protein n=1 Tax=Sphingobium fuliginis ATCC 27551 TaxID=1208342 RepID=A0A5B8CK73_SPHSA|nr:lytic transglycosylase domain-containing protein [Sphingobium fuliginis]QDC37231.1 lytic transglycosylase domain-containing protein [Sphingobium fuliginis ATCC 27551]
MDPLKLACAALALCAAVPARADAVDAWAPIIAEASARFGVPATWIERVMRAESRGQTTIDGRPIVSRAGAMGLMQLMPATWAEMRARLGLGPDPHAPRDNILAGTYFLRLMYDRFGYPGLFAAYNAGPGRYAIHLATGRALPGETRIYLANVAEASATAVPAKIADADEKPEVNAIFFTLSQRPGGRQAAGSASTLFVALSTVPERTAPDRP